MSARPTERSFLVTSIVFHADNKLTLKEKKSLNRHLQDATKKQTIQDQLRIKAKGRDRKRK